MIRRNFVRGPAAALIAAIALSCTAGSGGPPDVDFVVTSGDSTYWVTSTAAQSQVRGAPFLLAYVDGRFQEIYIVDDDRSYFDAVIVGQRIYSRDLISGDSSLILDNEVTTAVAAQYAKDHPGEAPLDDGEAENPDASTIASTDTDVIEVLGPYLTYEQHLDVEGPTLRSMHSTRRGVIDLRSRQAVTLMSLVGAGPATQLQTRGVSQLRGARDSIGLMAGARATRAREVMTGFVFDSTSFSLIESAGAPAIAFFVPGRGVRAGGYALPLQPIDIPAGRWWDEVRRTLPRAVPGGADEWQGATYDVVARYDSGAATAALFVRRRGRERLWAVARVQAPVRRVVQLPDGDGDSTRHALTRAFDDAVLYSGEARTAALTRTFNRQPRRQASD